MVRANNVYNRVIIVILMFIVPLSVRADNINQSFLVLRNGKIYDSKKTGTVLPLYGPVNQVRKLQTISISGILPTLQNLSDTSGALGLSYPLTAQRLSGSARLPNSSTVSGIADMDYNDNRQMLWSAGDKNGVYLVIARQVKQQEGFQIYYRPVTGSGFLPGMWYPGKPVDVAVADNRLQVFLSSGGAQSYTIGDDRTEARLPRGLKLLACCSWAGKLYALAVAQDNVSVEQHSWVQQNHQSSQTGLINSVKLTNPDINTNSDTNANTHSVNNSHNNNISKVIIKKNTAVNKGDGKNTSTSVNTNTKGDNRVSGYLSLLPNQCVIMQRDRDSRWRSTTGRVIDLNRWNLATCSLAVDNDAIHIFGIGGKQLREYKISRVSKNQNSSTRDSVLHKQFSYMFADRLEKTLSIKNPVAVKALVINQQLRIIVAIGPWSARRFYMGQSDGKGGYVFSGNLYRNHIVDNSNNAKANNISAMVTVATDNISHVTGNTANTNGINKANEANNNNGIRQYGDKIVTTSKVVKGSALGGVFEARAGRYSFAGFGSNIAVFEYCTDKKVLFGLYSTSGVLLEPVVKPVAAIDQSSNTFIIIFFGQELVTGIILIMILVVFRYRQEAFGEAVELPGNIQQAFLWQRLTSFAIDTIFIVIILQIIIAVFFPGLIEMFDNMPGLEAMLDQAQTGTLDSKIIKTAAILYPLLYGVILVYYTLWELFFAATPGKMIMQIHVTSVDGDKPSARAIIIRNLMRIVEWHPQIIMFSVFLIVLTRYSQRAGDLVAGTLVAKKSGSNSKVDILKG